MSPNKRKRKVVVHSDSDEDEEEEVKKILLGQNENAIKIEEDAQAPTEVQKEELEPDEYNVEHIIDDRFFKIKNRGYVRKFFVKWEGYEEKDNSWIERSDFMDPAYPDEYLKEKKSREAADEALNDCKRKSSYIKDEDKNSGSSDTQEDPQWANHESVPSKRKRGRPSKIPDKEPSFDFVPVCHSTSSTYEDTKIVKTSMDKDVCTGGSIDPQMVPGRVPERFSKVQDLTDTSSHAQSSKSAAVRKIMDQREQHKRVASVQKVKNAFAKRNFNTKKAVAEPNGSVNMKIQVNVTQVSSNLNSTAIEDTQLLPLHEETIDHDHLHEDTIVESVRSVARDIPNRQLVEKENGISMAQEGTEVDQRKDVQMKPHKEVWPPINSLDPITDQAWTGRLYAGRRRKILVDIRIQWNEGRQKCRRMRDELFDKNEIVLRQFISLSHIFKLLKAPSIVLERYFVVPAGPHSQNEVDRFSSWLEQREGVAVSCLPKTSRMVLFASSGSTSFASRLKIAKQLKGLLICAVLNVPITDSKPRLTELNAIPAWHLYKKGLIHSWIMENMPFMKSICHTTYSVFARTESPETNDLHKAMTSNSVLGKQNDSFDTDRTKVIFVHREFLNQINYIPNLLALRRRVDVHFYLFGLHIQASLNDPYITEIYPRGGIVTFTLQGLEKGMGVDFLQQLEVFKSVSRHEWRIEVHPKLFDEIKELCKSDVELAENLDGVDVSLHRACDSGVFSFMNEYKPSDSLVKDDTDQHNINALIYWSMLKRHADGLRNFRRFVIIHNVVDKKCYFLHMSTLIPGVEILTPRAFIQQIIQPYQSLNRITMNQ